MIRDVGNCIPMTYGLEALLFVALDSIANPTFIEEQPSYTWQLQYIHSLSYGL